MTRAHKFSPQFYTKSSLLGGLPDGDAGFSFSPAVSAGADGWGVDAIHQMNGEWLAQMSCNHEVFSSAVARTKLPAPGLSGQFVERPAFAVTSDSDPGLGVHVTLLPALKPREGGGLSALCLVSFCSTNEVLLFGLDENCDVQYTGTLMGGEQSEENIAIASEWCEAGLDAMGYFAANASPEQFPWNMEPELRALIEAMEQQLTEDGSDEDDEEEIGFFKRWRDFVVSLFDF